VSVIVFKNMRYFVNYFCTWIVAKKNVTGPSIISSLVQRLSKLHFFYDSKVPVYLSRLGSVF